MKKLFLSLAALIIISMSYAQQWSGPSNTTSTIYRSGNVGIGTSNPLNKFQIANGMSFHDGGHKIIGFGVAPGGTNVDLNPSTYSAEIRLNPNDGEFSLGVSTTVTNGPATRLLINKDGKVGIGSLNPDSKLTVKGNIHCEEVLVDLLVPADYVFQKYYDGTSSLKAEYQMPTLEEVEAFTKANHHLPEIPSAQEIKDNGLQLKEMSNLLLQKIEELTLYTIEQEKRIKALEAKLSKK